MRIELLTAAVSASAQLRGTADALFKNGDIVKALVAQQGDDGQLLIKVEGGNTLKALSDPNMNLTTGERLVLQVCRQGSGKTQMQILARDGGAAQAVTGRDGFAQPYAAQGNAAADTGKSTGAGAQAANDDAIAELCRLVSEAPGIGKALQKAAQALNEQFAAPKEAALPRAREQGVQNRTPETPIAAADAPRIPEKSTTTQPAMTQSVQKQVQIQQQTKNAADGTVPEQVATFPKTAGRPAQAIADTLVRDTITGVLPDDARITPGMRDAAAKPAPQGMETQRGVPEQNAMPAQNAPAQARPVFPPVREGAQNLPDAAAASEPAITREALIREVKALFVRPDAPDFDGESLKRQMESLNERLAELGQKALSAGADGKAIGTQIENHAAQMRQIEHIQQFTYVQIPVMMREKESTAELYVFHRDKRGKPVDPGATVVMLVLDTESMGKVESVVRAENKNVHIQMRVENERVARMFEGKAALLDRELEEAGYRLTQMACRVIEAPATPQNAQEIALYLLRDGTWRLDVVI